jgi:hypothetical protein
LGTPLKIQAHNPAAVEAIFADKPLFAKNNGRMSARAAVGPDITAGGLTEFSFPHFDLNQSYISGLRGSARRLASATAYPKGKIRLGHGSWTRKMERLNQRNF